MNRFKNLLKILEISHYKDLEDLYSMVDHNTRIRIDFMMEYETRISEQYKKKPIATEYHEANDELKLLERLIKLKILCN